MNWLEAVKAAGAMDDPGALYALGLRMVEEIDRLQHEADHAKAQASTLEQALRGQLVITFGDGYSIDVAALRARVAAADGP